MLIRKAADVRFLYFYWNYTFFFPLSTFVVTWFYFYILEFYLIFKHTFLIHSTYLVLPRLQVIRYSIFKITIPFGLFLYSGQYLEYFRFLKYSDIWKNFIIFRIMCNVGLGVIVMLDNYALKQVAWLDQGLGDGIFVGSLFHIPKMWIILITLSLLMKEKIYWFNSYLFVGF